MEALKFSLKDWNKFDQRLKRDAPEFDVFSPLDHPI